VEELIIDTGFAPVYVGNIDQALRIEAFGDLHEFGALGKTIIQKRTCSFFVRLKNCQYWRN
jgi:predicted dinucleotide-binding enzyme